MQSKDIIIQMNRSNYRVLNVHMLIALLCGHYQLLLKIKAYSNSYPACNKCGVIYSRENLFEPMDGCTCSLIIPGKYPMSNILSKENLVFLKFVDGLSLLFAFNTWRSEGFNVPEHWAINTFTLPRRSNKRNGQALEIWTDGSYNPANRKGA